jgi:hypothetical protein
MWRCECLHAVVLHTTAAVPNTQQHYNQHLGLAVASRRCSTAAPTSKGSTVRSSPDPMTRAGKYVPGRTISSAGLDIFQAAGRTQPMTSESKSYCTPFQMKQQLLAWRSQQHNERSTSCFGCLFVHAAGTAVRIVPGMTQAFEKELKLVVKV